MEAFIGDLLECTLTMTALAGLLLALSPLLARRYSPRCLYALWLVMLLGFAIPLRPQPVSPAMCVRLPQAPGMRMTALPAGMAPHALISDEEGAAEAGGEEAPLPAQPVTAAQALFCIWLTGAIAVFATSLWQHVRFMRTVCRWSRPIGDKQWLEALQQAKARMRVRRPVALRRCPAVDSPMLMGVFRPAILLPDLALTDRALELVLCHELYHLRRGDIPFKLLLLWARALHWFNPAMHFVSRAFAYHCEASCDAAVMRGADIDERQYYGETIISVIRRQTGLRSALSTNYYGGVNGMKRRILSIMDTGRRHMGAAVALLTAVLTLSTGMAFALEGAQEPPVRQAGAAQQSDAGREAEGETGTLAIVAGENRLGTRLLESAQAAAWDVPLGVYYNGAPVRVTGVVYEPNGAIQEWAHVQIECADGREALTGYMPLRDLVGATKADPASLPEAFVTVWQARLLSAVADAAPALRTYPEGTSLRLLGRVGDWYHADIDGMAGFIRAADVRVPEASAALTAPLQPGAFATRQPVLSSEDPAKWTFADRAAAWGGAHGVPRDEDIPAERAVRIAQEAVQVRYGVDDGALEPVEGNGIYYIKVEENGTFVSDTRTSEGMTRLQRPYYQVNLLRAGDPREMYTVYIQPVTGEVMAVAGPEDGNG